MKKKFLIPFMVGTMVLSMTACSNGDSTENTAADAEAITEISKAAMEAASAASSDVSLANPWRDITEDEAYTYITNPISAPEGAENVVWSVMESAADPSGFPGPLVQMTFDLDGNSFTARQQMTGDSEGDISGVYYTWTTEDECTLANWAEGQMPAKTYRYIGDGEYVDLITWFDFELGSAYSLTVTAPDLDGFDIQAVAEQMCDPEKMGYSSIPDEIEDEHQPMDITGCDTFTQIVDKLEDGMAYANATINDTDVLLVSEYTFDNSLDASGQYAAIDADVYCYNKEGAVEYLGYVTAGGTAYPLAIGDGELYLGANHFIKKMMIYEGIFCIDEEAYVEYDKTGAATYYYHSDIKDVEADENGQVKDDSVMQKMYGEYGDAEVIEFIVVGK